MNACELNVLITAITNHLYQTLSKEDFKCLAAVLNELSKSMFTTVLFGEFCDKHDRNDHRNPGR